MITGHSDWVKTYQRIPTLIDETLEKLGGQRLLTMGTTDAKDRDMFSDFETWEENFLWPAIKKRFGESDDGSSAHGLKVSFSAPRASSLRQEVKEALVVDSRRLSKVSDVAGEEKRHLEVRLPSDWAYSTGDYLAVLPHNTQEVVGRAMRRFNLAWDAHVSIEAKGPTSLPTNVSIPVSDVLNSYVELSQSATKRVSFITSFMYMYPSSSPEFSRTSHHLSSLPGMSLQRHSSSSWLPTILSNKSEQNAFPSWTSLSVSRACWFPSTTFSRFSRP